jgi:TldD protein
MIRTTRRTWLLGTVRTSALGVLAPTAVHALQGRSATARPRSGVDAETRARLAAHAASVDPEPLYALGTRGVEAALRAGASYADTRLTRTVRHQYDMGDTGRLSADDELLGIGVRALVNGYWGFAACPLWDADEVTRLAADAVAQARVNAFGGIRTVELGKIPVARGTWATPIRVDPFTVPIEEKLDAIVYWKACAERAGIPFVNQGMSSGFSFTRQERILVTSEGTRTTQTRYEIGGVMQVERPPLGSMWVRGLETAGKGWELLQDANPPEQFPKLLDDLRKQAGHKVPIIPGNVGRYTIVCDGRTMASMLDETLGAATQLDRALGYEANASGTSYLSDPLAMLGHLAVASPLVTMTANRSAPAELATVKWDEEGVEATETTLVTKGVLTDFQTTREQAAWLAPYYTRAGRPVRSNGCANAEDALAITLQHMPNLAIAPHPSALNTDALIASIKTGLFIEGGRARCDFQGRNGLLRGQIREITNGRLGALVANAGVYFNSLDFWKHVTAVGDRSTEGLFQVSQFGLGQVWDEKGEPAQRTSHSVRSPAAIIDNQTIINPARKA